MILQVVSVYISVLIWNSPMALWPWRAVFCTLSFLVQLLRTAGYILFFVEWANEGKGNGEAVDQFIDKKAR